MAQIQLNLSSEMLREIDRWVSEGKFTSRSDAIKNIISLYEERERKRDFLQMLKRHSEEARKRPQTLVSLE